MKMYILIRDSVPTGLAVVAAAHASLATYLKFQDTAEVSEWLSGSFRKVVCAVGTEEFEDAKQCCDRVVLTESAMDGQEVAIAFKPRQEWPVQFRRYRLYS